MKTKVVEKVKKIRKIKPSKIKQTVKSDILKRYHKIRYATRIKHFRGRNIHSPFTYGLVREALMDKNDVGKYINTPLYQYLRQNKISSKFACKACRVHTFLGCGSCCFDYKNYQDEDMLIITDIITPQQIDEIIDIVNNNNKRVCVIISKIYSSIEQHNVWHHILEVNACVAIDLYSISLLFFDKNLNPQHYKMKL